MHFYVQGDRSARGTSKIMAYPKDDFQRGLSLCINDIKLLITESIHQSYYKLKHYKLLPQKLEGYVCIRNGMMIVIIIAVVLT